MLIVASPFLSHVNFLPSDPLIRLTEDHLAKSPEEVFDILGKLGEG